MIVTVTAEESWKSYISQWVSSDASESPVVLVGMGAKQAISEFLASDVVPLDEVEVIDSAFEGKSISIKELRDLFARVGHTAPQGRRVIIIRDIERLSLPASHSLLKTLEEPSVTNRFLLTTQYPGRLLETIRSRVQLLRVSATPEDVGESLEGWLTKWQSSVGKKRSGGLKETELREISAGLSQMVHSTPSPAVYRALLRLRDYYKVSARSGNEKLASEVLLACLAEIQIRP